MLSRLLFLVQSLFFFCLLFCLVRSMTYMPLGREIRCWEARDWALLARERGVTHRGKGGCHAEKKGARGRKATRRRLSVRSCHCSGPLAVVLAAHHENRASPRPFASTFHRESTVHEGRNVYRGRTNGEKKAYAFSLGISLAVLRLFSRISPFNRGNQ